DLSKSVNERISELHQAVNKSSEVKSQIQSLHKRVENDQRVKAPLTTADELDHKMSDVEQQLGKVNMKGSEGNLAFPNMLNERFDTFSHVIDAGDTEPTKQHQEVFQMLSAKLDEQLKKWTQLKTEDVPKISASIKQLDLPALVITEKKSE